LGKKPAPPNFAASMDQPHVVFFPAWYPHRGDPMPGLFVKYHAASLLPHARVSVLQVLGESRRTGDLIEFDYQEEDGLATMRVYYRKQESKLGKIIDAYHYLYGSLKGYSLLIARQGKADLHHVHVLTRAGFLPWLIRISGGIPYLVTEHWSRYHQINRHKFGGSLKKWLTRQVVKKAFAVCPVNENLGNAMQEMGFTNPRFQVINNVVDLKRFSLNPNPAPASKFLHVSCFDEAAKNTHGLLRAFKAALAKHPSLFLTLVGEGPDWETTQAYAAELGLSPYTDFVGLKMGDDLVKAYHEHGSMVMFSNYENQPVVILEAFACGTPVIATRVGGIHDMLADGRGRLLEAGNEAELTRVLCEQAEGKNMPDPKMLRQYVQESFSYEAVGNMYFALYQEALA